MRKLLLLSLLVTACDPAGYYVANVFSSNGQLFQERCEITAYNKRPDPSACHVEPVSSAPSQAAYPAYPPQPRYQTPPAPPAPPPPPPPPYAPPPGAY